MQSWGGTSDAFNTKGRVKKGTDTYAILSQVKPPYNKVEYRTPGTYTITIPPGATPVKVTLAGAGGGGGGGLDYKKGTGSDHRGTLKGGTGGRGALITQSCNVSAGAYAVIVGQGGVGGAGARVGLQGAASGGNTGGASSVFSVIATGGTGGGGASRYSSGPNDGANGQSYGEGGYGGAGGNGAANGSAGSPGWVIIEYGGNI